jgi:hypothetical protein
MGDEKRPPVVSMRVGGELVDGGGMPVIPPSPPECVTKTASPGPPKQGDSSERTKQWLKERHKREKRTWRFVWIAMLVAAIATIIFIGIVFAIFLL